MTHQHGAGLHAHHCDGDMPYFGQETVEQLGAEGNPRGRQRDQRPHRYWPDKTMGPLEQEPGPWAADLAKGS